VFLFVLNDRIVTYIGAPCNSGVFFVLREVLPKESEKKRP